MSQVAQIANNATLLHDFFVKCIGTGDSRQLMDVVITDSIIQQLKHYPEKNATRVVDRVEAYDINYVFDNNKFRTYRIPKKNWDRSISLIRKMVNAGPEGYAFAKGEEDPREQLLLTDIANQYFKQQVVMQDLGLDYPVSLLLTDYSSTAGENITDGDIVDAEKKFHRAGELLVEAFRLVKRNLTVLHADPSIKRDHILYYANFIDFQTRHVYACLQKFGTHLTGVQADDFDILPTKLDPEAWKGVFTSENSQTALLRLGTAFNSYNAFVDAHFSTEDQKEDLLSFAIEQLFARNWGNIMKSSELVYNIELGAVKELVDAANEKLMQEVADLEGQPGLDINSWKVYDYTDATAPVFVKEIGPELYKAYRQEFVGLMYQVLLTSGHTLLRPFSVKTVITDPEKIAEHKVGEVRTERF